MSLFIASLNSGSNGNCYYIGNNEEAILVDAGISCRETENRMKRLNLPMNAVKAIFVSHEHTDHVQGVPVIARKYALPVYITSNTLAGCRWQMPHTSNIFSFQAHVPVEVGTLRITAFPKQHDAVEPHSFTVTGSGVTVGIFTDIGSPCKNVITHFKQCHAAFLEANYDESMLQNGHYPFHLKKRISGTHGHLSNRQALELFTTHKPSYMSHLLLSHLSKENNHPQLVENLFRTHAGAVNIVVASRYKETSVYEVTPNPAPQAFAATYRSENQPFQLSLF